MQKISLAYFLRIEFFNLKFWRLIELNRFSATLDSVFTDLRLSSCLSNPSFITELVLVEISREPIYAQVFYPVITANGVVGLLGNDPF